MYERPQYVEWQNNMSQPCELRSIVPQESMLVPLLFIFPINDLCYFMAHTLIEKLAFSTPISIKPCL